MKKLFALLLAGVFCMSMASFAQETGAKADKKEAKREMKAEKKKAKADEKAEKKEAKAEKKAAHKAAKRQKKEDKSETPEK